MPRPDLSRVPSFFHNYISQVQEDALMQALKNNTEVMQSFLINIPPAKYEYRYAEGKWTIKEVLQHLIDAERVFCYRALRFSRKDTTPLPGFDENLFARTAKANGRKWNDLVEEFFAVRKATELLFASFDEEQLEAGGISGNHPNYTLAMGFIAAGHCNHHKKVLEVRYL